MKIEAIKKGVMNNLSVKNPLTLEVKPSIEGNSYFGVCIFVGVARMFNFSHGEINEMLTDDMENVLFMEEKFLQILGDYFHSKNPSETEKALFTKTNLVLNHIKLNHGKTVSLAQIIKDKIR